MPVQSFKDLVVWQKAIDLVVEVYQLTKGFSDFEKFGLANQLRRASVSIPSNIAEGQGRGASDDLVRFLRIAKGSLQEVDTQLTIAVRLGYLTTEQYEPVSTQITETARLLHGLIRSVNN